ncbi:MAG: D-alanyl-D-alanine carboxypeptidase/D-alanyl-D-alanine-endopeptidase [Gammaproteobacteria bacterium]|nr:D-alanyl-D-alanine carboxypeptidase/D-alanyl-D-alanine-endopeptidase [Gammaproteobacteria bacterium]
MKAFCLIVSIWIAIFLSNPTAWASTKHEKHKVHRHTVTVKRTYKKIHTLIFTASHMTTPVYGVSHLADELNEAINEKNFNAAIAVYVRSMKYGDTLYTRNINQPLMPASTLKVLTAEAALLYLGPDYQFSTELLTDAKSIKGGILQGNLYIVLSGDPSLLYSDLVDLLLTLQAHQIKGIAGNVYIDNTAYDQSFYGPGWEWTDKKYCYAAPISASIINHNCLPFQIMPAKVIGKAAQVMTSTKYFYPTIRNTVVTKARHTHACSLRLLKNPDSEISLEGCMPVGRYTWGVSYVVENVPEYDRALFKNLLNQLSIKIDGSVGFASAPSYLSLISSHHSKPLSMLIMMMLKKSDNVIAGALFKKIGQLYMQRPGSWENGSIAVSHILSRRAGVNISGMRILDGSGLSPANLTTPAQLMQVLTFAYHDHPTSADFISALPIAGVDGTLKYRMSHIARKVRAKTGTISGVVSLAGYAVSGDKEPLAFVIMINGSKGLSWRYKALEDKIATALTRYRR